MMITKDACEQYYIVLEEHSWNTFTISPKGDLFINGDWGYWAFNWRAFGDNFKMFIIGMNAEYLIDKIESNELMFDKNKMGVRRKAAITAHFKAFQDELKREIKVLEGLKVKKGIK
jgi:hypothetical protein